MGGGGRAVKAGGGGVNGQGHHTLRTKHKQSTVVWGPWDGDAVVTRPGNASMGTAAGMTSVGTSGSPDSCSCRVRRARCFMSSSHTTYISIPQSNRTGM